MEHFDQELQFLDSKLAELTSQFPEVEAISDLHGIGLYSALLIVGEIDEPWRFRDGRLVGAYAGLTPRVSQSGDHEYYGHITHQGSPWLRWILVQAAVHVVKKDGPVRVGAYNTRAAVSVQWSIGDEESRP